MNKILLLALCIFAFNVQSAEVKQDTIHKYVIDKQVVTDFNGTQLEGKTISKYIIAYKNEGKKVIKNHVIYTEKPTITLQSTDQANSLRDKSNAIIIVDGKEMSQTDFQNIKPENIAGVVIHKAGSEVAKSYGKKGEQGVVMVTTNANKDKGDPTYIIDGKVATRKDLDKLSPEKIASINVNRKEGNGVITITTKK